jgi:cell division protein ZipA
MPELRIILLVLGVLFVAAIAGFEWWRSRGQRPVAVASRGGARNEDPDDAPAPAPAPRPESRPLPEINVVREPRIDVSEALPVIELDSATESGTRRALGISISREVAVDGPYVGQDDEVSEVRVLEPPSGGEAPSLKLAWPSESERRIVTVRVMPRGEPRFQGRLLRQAFASAGFWHGPMEIFHLPDEHGTVMLSAAALAQPGTFDPSIMDSQRFSGLNLFAVLPGPLPERQIFEELIHAARQLAERLDGQVTDQHGEELTAARITRLRQSLDQPAATRVSGQA